MIGPNRTKRGGLFHKPANYSDIPYSHRDHYETTAKECGRRALRCLGYGVVALVCWLIAFSFMQASREAQTHMDFAAEFKGVSSDNPFLLRKDVKELTEMPRFLVAFHYWLEHLLTAFWKLEFWWTFGCVCVILYVVAFHKLIWGAICRCLVPCYYNTKRDLMAAAAMRHYSELDREADREQTLMSHGVESQPEEMDKSPPASHYKDE